MTNPNQIEDRDPYVMYAECMTRVKLRTELVLELLEFKYHVKYIQTTAETIALQVRIILELIALASLVANRTEYEKQRSNFYKDWNVKRILTDLRHVNPKFYPSPHEPIRDAESGKIVEMREIKSGFLTEIDFEMCLNSCSKILHASNPFSPTPDANRFLELVPEWIKNIGVLLHNHSVQLADKDKQLWISMGADIEDNVQVTEYTRVNEKRESAILRT